VIYSYNKSKQDALFLKFILIKDSTGFGQIIYCLKRVEFIYQNKLEKECISLAFTIRKIIKF